ncbi:hypothetical protein F5Y15DRAFT_410658 [Xylariaceae sp. FL0016]|nr:hypothetical protein F5Y15DRAFT_410658 [Xylariaceae sp. FL0016]
MAVIPPQLGNRYDELRNFFGGEGPYLKPLKYLGKGANNFAVLYAEFDRDTEKRKAVVKTSIKAAFEQALLDDLGFGNVGGADDLDREIGALQRFTGDKAHIVKLLSVIDNLQRARQSGPGPTQSSILIQEYVPNGTLQRLVNRVGRRNLPDRLISSIFLCLVRIATELAYQAENGDGIPSDGNIAPSNLAHCDLTWSNLVFGEVLGGEHDPWPILKAIE